MTKTLYAATSAYVGEINKLPVKRQVSVSGILKKLDVSRSGYNAWKKRVPSDTSIRRTVLKEKIQKIYEDCSFELWDILSQSQVCPRTLVFHGLLFHFVRL